MEKLNHLRERFLAAFRRYSTQDSKMRKLQRTLPEDVDSACIHNINQQSHEVSNADGDYQAIRSQYVDRLLSKESI